VKPHRSTTILLGLGMGWLVDVLVLAPLTGVGPAGMQENVGPLSWPLVSLLTPVFAVAALDWLLELALVALRVRSARKRDA